MFYNMSTVFKTRRQRIAWILIAINVANLLAPATSYALTSGPTQPEVQSFQPAGTTDMVDLFSGDFSYNIPLFELPGPNGGYPFNLSYQAGITMEQEASWVGLGWSLNPGAINRQMRGLPDDFNGDEIKTKMSIKPAVTTGVGGGGGFEIFGGSDKRDIGNLGLSIFYNNYKGFGYSVDAAAGFSPSVRSGMTSAMHIGASLTLNSQEGANAAPSLSLGSKIGVFGVSAGYNSLRGLQDISFTHTKELRYTPDTKKTNRPRDTWQASTGTYASLGLAHPGYVPQVSMPMLNFSVSARISGGGAWWGAYGKTYIKGFYTEQKLRNDGVEIASKAYGYLNYDAGMANDESVLDFNREKDGMVSMRTPNLAIPSMTYDIYSVTGQGISAMYRPVRNDIGVLRDPKVTSESTGTGIGIDGAVNLSHVGVNLTVNHSNSVSGSWTEDNDMDDLMSFQSKTNNDRYEPWNFKVHGELTGEKKSIFDNIGGTNAVRIELDQRGGEIIASTELKGRSGIKQLDENTIDRSRKQRNEVIQPFTKRQILKDGGATEIVPYFRNEYFNNGSSVTTPFNRGTDNLDHIAGFSATTPDGLRYNYTIPAYNNVQEEMTFAVDGATADQYFRVGVPGATGDNDPVPTAGDKFFKKVSVPKYAHAYLLTSILGADYVDVGDDGVTADDLGYWVKFTYEKKSDYKWREPFSNANYIEGWKTDNTDDRGSYTYGAKEIWYLRRAETKSHIAEFNTVVRDDAKGVTIKNQLDATALGSQSFKLDNVVLYSRATAGSYPIKTVRFSYSTSLCTGTPNSNGTPNGKLTLDQVTFQYGNGVGRAGLNPYKFSYNNRAYERNGYDRWGTYKPTNGNARANIDLPYTDQNPDNKTNIDSYAASWSLSQIQTPSGNTIKVSYESDDYGYVQHKQAMQMEKIYNPAVAVGSAETETTPYALPQSGPAKIRFKLQQKISVASNPDQAKIVKSYMGSSNQVFVKLYMKLVANDPNSYEYISGYVDVDAASMALESIGSDYIYGVFYLKNDPSRPFHPFTKLAWQHLRTNQPNLLRTRTSTANEKVVDQIRDLVPMFDDLRMMFSGFDDYCDDRDFGKTIDLTKTRIRLNSTDKVKYGGGLRVKQITMSDNWGKDKDGIYGQIYDYRILEDGNMISSGVATYEPLIGGEENPLRYAKAFTESVPLRSDNNLYFEFPVNESYYPAPQVGYRKVTVMSLPAAALAGVPLANATTTEAGQEKNIFPKSGNNTWGTSGKTVHEFYTAKDFPVLTDETDKDDKSLRISIPVPFLGNVSISNLTSTQGYSIITNDMHGKQKQVSTYRQLSSGAWEEEPISWVKYNYMTEQQAYQSEKVLTLKNDFKLNVSDSTLRLPAQGEIADYTLGQENEFFVDMREHSDNTWEGGASGNLDLVYIPIFVPIPVPTIWPSIGKSNSRLRTAVTNKVIFRPGILGSTEVYDGGSIVKTTNLKWDKLTGQVVLISTTNNFDQPIYTYTIPAHTQYKGLGGAYQNVGLQLAIQKFFASPGTNNYSFPSFITSALYPGDELIIYKNDVAKARVIYMGESGGTKQVNNLTTGFDLLSDSDYTAIVVRSGYRNQLNATAGSITALADPTTPSAPIHYPKPLKAPSNP